MSKALIYCRVSTEEQAEKGFSLDAQEKYCREFVKRNGYEVGGVFRDDGKSGTTLERPALKALLSQIEENHGIGAVVVQETDRLARNTIDHLTIKALLKKAKVKLISVAQPMLDDSPEGRMIDTIIASVNQFQSDANSRKTKKGMQERFESGLWPTYAPLGYLNKEVDGRRIIVSDPQRWHLIRECLKLYLTGNYSAFELSDIMYQKGLQSRTNKKICNSIMTHMLRHPFYAGIMVWQDHVRKGNHEPMITVGEHEQIIQILAAHNFHASRRRVHHFLLLGFVHCSICGGRYTAELHGKRNMVYYHCDFQGKRGNDKPHTNRNQNIPNYELEQQIEEKFGEIQFTSEAIDLIMKTTKIVYGKWKGDSESQKRALLNQKQALELKRDTLEDKLLKGIISDTDYQRMQNKINHELTKIQNQLFVIENQHPNFVKTIEDVLNLTKNIRSSYLSAPYELKQQYLSLFWEKFLVQDRQIIQAIPSTIMQGILTQNRGMVRSNLLPSSRLRVFWIGSIFYSNNGIVIKSCCIKIVCVFSVDIRNPVI